MGFFDKLADKAKGALNKGKEALEKAGIIDSDGTKVERERKAAEAIAAEKQEKIKEDKNREQDTYTQNRYYNELMEKAQKLIRLIEKRKNAKNSELKRFLKEVDRIVDRWD